MDTRTTNPVRVLRKLSPKTTELTRSPQSAFQRNSRRIGGAGAAIGHVTISPPPLDCRPPVYPLNRRGCTRESPPKDEMAGRGTSSSTCFLQRFPSA